MIEKRLALISLLLILGSAIPLNARPAAGGKNVAGDPASLSVAAFDLDTSSDTANATPTWVAISINDKSGEFTDQVLGESNSTVRYPDDLALLADSATPLPPATPGQAKVPEPSTLALLGGGMIGIARVSRRRLSFRGRLTPQIVCALLREA